MPTNRDDPFRAGKAPMAARKASAPRVKTMQNPEAPSYGHGPSSELTSSFINANQDGKDPHSGRFPPGAQPQLRGQQKEDNRRQENRDNQAMHSSGSGMPMHEYERTPPAGNVP